MTNEKPLTEARLIAVLKKAGVATKSDLAELEEKMISEMARLAEDITSTADKRHDKVIEHIDNLELKTVKRSEFEALKRQVERMTAH